MTIGEVSKEYQISHDTLRYYEKIGLIDPVPRKSGQRDYDTESLERINFIRCMKNAGFSLEDIIQFIAYHNQGEKTASKRLEMLLDRKEKLLAEMKEKEKTLDFLNYKIELYQTEEKEKNK